MPSASLVPPADDRSVLFDDRGHAAAEALLPRARRSARADADECSEVLSHSRHRPRRRHFAPPDVLRDARQLLDRCLLQGRGDPLRVGALPASVLVRPRRHLGDGVLRRRGTGAGARRGGDRVVAGDRRAARADRRLSALGELLGSRPRRPERTVLGAVLDRGLSFGAPDDLPGGENERFLEYWNLVFMQYDQDPHDTLRPLAHAQHRHRPWPEPHGGDPAGQGLGVRHRPVPAADRPRSGARRSSATVRIATADRALRILADHARGMSFLSPTAWSPPTKTAAMCCVD